MIICLCGNDKTEVINELKKFYNDKLIIFNYYHAVFKTIIATERIKYKLQDKFEDLNEARNIYHKIINNIITKKTNDFIEQNKDKIIILISDNLLSNDLDKTTLFDKANLKILINTIVSKYNYDESKFDFIINKNENINIKEMIKL